MVTDPARIRKTDPGHPEICTVFAFHRIFSDDEVNEIEYACKGGQIGCVQCKKKLALRLAGFHRPIYEKRTALLSDRKKLADIIAEGSAKAEIKAEKNMNEVRKALRIGLADG